MKTFSWLRMRGIKNNSYICEVIMPEIFRAFGFSFYFFSREHEPIHVHVMGNDGSAKFVFDGETFVVEEYRNIKANDLKKITKMIEENTDVIIRHWNKYFGNE